MDAIELIRTDHQEVERLFKQFEHAHAPARRRELVDKMILELARHSVVEEEFLYPALRERSARDEELTLQALEEHHVVKWLLLELHKLDENDERFAAKTRVLMENVRAHVKIEERALFPLLRAQFTREELVDLASMMELAKQTAPTHPHPRAPDEPPENFLAGVLAAAFDRGRDFLSGIGELRAPRELAARVLRRETPKRKANRDQRNKR